MAAFHLPLSKSWVSFMPWILLRQLSDSSIFLFSIFLFSCRQRYKISCLLQNSYLKVTTYQQVTGAVKVTIYPTFAISKVHMSPFNLNLGLLLLRIATGGLLLFHGIAKLALGFDFIKSLLAEKGLPLFLWLGVPLTEVIAPILLISGVFTRMSGICISFLMALTIILAHAAEAFSISGNGGLSIELNLLYLSCGLTLFFTGGGKYALYKPANEWLR